MVSKTNQEACPLRDPKACPVRWLPNISLLPVTQRGARHQDRWAATCHRGHGQVKKNVAAPGCCLQWPLWASVSLFLK